MKQAMRQTEGLRNGYRGYIASRPIGGNRTPQHVQNLVVRDYANRRDLPFILSATEFAIPGCYVVLEGVMQDLDSLAGVILYSLFMLPDDVVHRQAIYDRIVRSDATLFAAVEDYQIRSRADVSRVEEIWLISETLKQCPTVI